MNLKAERFAFEAYYLLARFAGHFQSLLLSFLFRLLRPLRVFGFSLTEDLIHQRIAKHQDGGTQTS